MTGVKNSPKGLADDGLGKRGTAGYNTRTLATKADVGSHIPLDATATSKEEHVDDRIGGGDEDGMVIQEKLSKEGVVPDAIQDQQPHRPHLYKHRQVSESALEVVQGGLELLQDELAKEIWESPWAGLIEAMGDGPEETLEDTG